MEAVEVGHNNSLIRELGEETAILCKSLSLNYATTAKLVQLFNKVKSGISSVGDFMEAELN